ncbi:photosynthetic reaction center cytochrome c subunit family protein [Emticicia sp. W12TSBA100-4]|uniref:photosynthetic reaction center cytochrome c subunit family protein n=1 Tax=Emticicia sp. W12TSBA100-4 TaxID=3160965 RepID=UPI00330608DF
MKLLLPVLFLFIGVSSFMSMSEQAPQASPKVVAKDTMMLDREKYLTKLKDSLKGKESMVADSVFKNIKSLKGKSVEQVLSIMNNWGHALGVTCKFCHETTNWASEKSRNHLRTREMIVMNDRLNRDLLSQMKGFRQPVTMGCISCHNEMKEPPHDGPRPQGPRQRPEGAPKPPEGAKN